MNVQSIKIFGAVLESLKLVANLPAGKNFAVGGFVKNKGQVAGFSKGDDEKIVFQRQVPGIRGLVIGDWSLGFGQDGRSYGDRCDAVGREFANVKKHSTFNGLHPPMSI